MDKRTLARRRAINLAQTGLLLLVIVAVTAWMTALFFGPGAVPWVVAGVALGLLLSPQVPYAVHLRMQGALPLSPRQAPELYEALTTLCRRAGIPRVPPIYYIPRHEANAFAMGTREDAVIGLTRGLLQLMHPREVIAILAHEIAHIQHNDLRFMLLASGATHFVAGLALMAWVLLCANLPLAIFGLNPVPLAPLLLGVAMPTVVVLLQMALSRIREYDADLESARLTGRPEWLISALRKLEQTHAGMLENLRVGRQRLALLSTHPPVERRVARLRELLPPARQHPLPLPADPVGASLLEALMLQAMLPPDRRRPWWW